MSDFAALRAIIQEDVGGRGLAADPADNLLTARPGDLAAACYSLAAHPAPVLAVVTGFFIPTAAPPAGETDGPPGAVFLARVLPPLGIHVVIVSDPFALAALHAGLAVAGVPHTPLVAVSPDGTVPWPDDRVPTHLLALERPGPTADGRCYTMRGRDITDLMRPAHRLFDPRGRAATIGIGDGGNEIGMGAIPFDTIRRNIPRGELVACRIATDFLIVAGVSNWGAYALAVGTGWCRGRSLVGELDEAREWTVLAALVEAGPLVDGVTGKPALTVDGLDWATYWGPMRRMAELG